MLERRQKGLALTSFCSSGQRSREAQQLDEQVQTIVCCSATPLSLKRQTQAENFWWNNISGGSHFQLTNPMSFSDLASTAVTPSQPWRKPTFRTCSSASQHRNLLLYLVGIRARCTISPFILTMEMEIIIRTSVRVVGGRRLSSPLHDITTLTSTIPVIRTC